MKDFTSLLQSEIRPALGVTEVGAIALAAARAYAAVGGEPLHIQMVMNGGMYKNGFSCGIPGTEEIGCSMAAALGVVAGKWELGLQCLQGVEATHIAAAKQLPTEITVAPEWESIRIEAEVTTTRGVGLVHIRDRHDNIVYVAANDDVLVSRETAQQAETVAPFDFDGVTIAEMVDYVDNVALTEISFIQDMIDMNGTLSEKGKDGVGLCVGKIQRSMGEDAVYAAQGLTCCAMDARLAGLPYPAMSIVGSGSHGILCSLPVVSYGRSIGATADRIQRAVALSGLVTIYSKHYTGRLSPLCGCILGGGSGAAAGIVYLMGGSAAEVSHAINHMAANLTGMICDGGSLGCALKAAAGVYSAFLSARLAMEGIGIPPNFGVVGSTAEQTAKNLGRISAEGMAPMDAAIIDIMQAGR